MQYAQIKNGKVNLIEIADEIALADLQAAGLTIVDISQLETEPQIGWEYDEDTGAFAAPEEQSSDCVYLHLVMSGGDGGDPPGLANDGEESITVNATFRAGENADSDIITAVDITRRINIKDSSGNIADIVKVAFTAGVCQIDYTTTGVPGIYHLDEDDFIEKINGMGIKLLGDTEFKVYRDFTV